MQWGARGRSRASRRSSRLRGRSIPSHRTVLFRSAARTPPARLRCRTTRTARARCLRRPSCGRRGRTILGTCRARLAARRALRSPEAEVCRRPRLRKRGQSESCSSRARRTRAGLRHSFVGAPSRRRALQPHLQPHLRALHPRPSPRRPCLRLLRSPHARPRSRHRTPTSRRAGRARPTPRGCDRRIPPLDPRQPDPSARACPELEAPLVPIRFRGIHPRGGRHARAARRVWHVLARSDAMPTHATAPAPPRNLAPLPAPLYRQVPQWHPGPTPI